MEPLAQILSTHEQSSAGQGPGGQDRAEAPLPDTRGEPSFTGISNLAQSCRCSCHHKSLSRSPRAVDRIFGTLFIACSGFSSTIPKCNVPSCAHSCAGPDIALSLTYFFPLWLLSWGINLKFTPAIRGFNHHFRIIQFVEYSSPIFRCAYEGDVSRMKALLKGRLASPFDVTFEPQRSLLGVCFCPQQEIIRY